MADVDTSFYPTQQPAPYNPLTTVQQVAGIQGTLQQNQLVQQQIRGRIALGKLIQSNTDPKTGVLNGNALMRDVANDRDAQMFALQTAQEVQDVNRLTPYTGPKGQPLQAPYSQVVGIGNPAQQAQSNPPPSQQQIDDVHKHWDTMESIVKPLADNPNVNQKDVINAVSDAVAHPDTDFHATDGAALISQLPSGPNGTPATSQQLQPIIQQRLQQVQNAKAILDKKYPSSEQIAARKAAAQFAQGGGSQETNTQSQEPQPQQTAQNEFPGSATGMVPGYAENQAARQRHFLDVQNDANSVANENAALRNVLDLSKKGAPTGTLLGEFSKWAGGTGIAPQTVDEQAAALALIKSHAAQLATANGLPGSDARLSALENAKVGDKDLPQVIQSMVPYLLGVNQGRLQRASYYNKVAGNGLDPDKVAQAQSNWNNNSDPRLFEMQILKDDPKEFQKFTSGLSKEDKSQLLNKYRSAKQLGIIQ